MSQYNYPLSLQFKISTLANDFTAKDANGNTIAYVKQKMFKFKEEINIFSNESQSTQLYQIKANKWLDFSASYNFTDNTGKELGKVSRKGFASFWKAHYELHDENGNQDLSIQEENPWVKVLDALFKEIPIVSMLTGYFFNPSYTVKRPDGTLVARLKKTPSFFGRKFSVDKISEFEAGEENRTILGLTMMILLERRRG